MRLTLDDAIARGLSNSQRLAELLARKEGAEAAEAGRAAAAMPSVALIGGYTRTNHVDEFGIAQPGQPPRIIYPDVPNNYRARIDLNWPVYSGGRTDALGRAAAAERQATGEDVAAARSDLRLEITRAFWALVAAIETEQVLARSLDNIGAHVRDLRNRFEQGLIAPNEVLSAEAQQSRQRVLAIEAANTRAICEADLRRLIGLDTRDRIEPAAALDATTAVEPSSGRASSPRRAGSGPSAARSVIACRRPRRGKRRPAPARGRRSASTAATTTRGRTRASFRGSGSGGSRGTPRST